jgi:hypothetical protein
MTLFKGKCKCGQLARVADDAQQNRFASPRYGMYLVRVILEAQWNGALTRSIAPYDFQSTRKIQPNAEFLVEKKPLAGSWCRFAQCGDVNVPKIGYAFQSRLNFDGGSMIMRVLVHVSCNDIQASTRHLDVFHSLSSAFSAQEDIFTVFQASMSKGEVI